jgi:hypothetical protein
MCPPTTPPRRFSEAEKVLQLELEASAPPQDMSLHQWVLTDADLVPNILLAATADGDPAAYVSSFEKLAGWVDGSLDLYKVCGCVVRLLG